MTDATEVFCTVFLLLVSVAVVPLLSLRILHILVKAHKVRRPNVGDDYWGNFLRRMWVLSTVNKLFVPLIGYPLYLIVGPWFIGEVIEGHIGAAFAWGTVVKWTVLPTSFTYFYGIIQLFWFHIPLTVIMSYCVDCRFRDVCLVSGGSHRWGRWIHISCASLLLVQSIFAYYFWLAYGTIAFLLGPLRTWSVIMGIYMWYSSTTLSPTDFVEVYNIWRESDLRLNGEAYAS